MRPMIEGPEAEKPSEELGQAVTVAAFEKQALAEVTRLLASLLREHSPAAAAKTEAALSEYCTRFPSVLAPVCRALRGE